MRTLYILLVLIFLSVSVQAQNVPLYRLNLQECIELALRNNEDIKAASYDILESIAKKIEPTKRYVPVIEYKYRVAPVPQDVDDPLESFFVHQDISVFNSISLEAGIPVTTFGQLTLYQQLADIGIDASQLQQQRTASDVVLDIYKLYQGILLAQEIERLGQRGIDAIQKNIEELEKKETTDQLQILKLKVALYQVEKELDDAIKKKVIAHAALKFRLGLEQDVDLRLKSNTLAHEHFPRKSFEELLDVSKVERPEFSLLQCQVDAKAKEIEIAKTKFYPKLILGGFFEYGYAPGITGDEDESDYSNPFNFAKGGVGFELRSGSLDIRKQLSELEQAKAKHLKSIADKRSKYSQLELDLRNSWLDLEQKRKLLWRAEEEEKSARQIVFLTKSNYDIGIGEKKDYLEALQSFLLIQAAVLRNVYDYNVAVATVKNKMGVLYDKELIRQAWK
jgi:outer membrane protein TolC